VCVRFVFFHVRNPHWVFFKAGVMFVELLRFLLEFFFFFCWSFFSAEKFFDPCFDVFFLFFEFFFEEFVKVADFVVDDVDLLSHVLEVGVCVGS